LLHGDYGKHNILCNDNSITAIIDPQGYIGDPLWDVGYVCCHSPAPTEFLSGYAPNGFTKDEQHRLHTYTLAQAFRKLGLVEMFLLYPGPEQHKEGWLRRKQEYLGIIKPHM